MAKDERESNNHGFLEQVRLMRFFVVHHRSLTPKFIHRSMGRIVRLSKCDVEI